MRLLVAFLFVCQTVCGSQIRVYGRDGFEWYTLFKTRIHSDAGARMIMKEFGEDLNNVSINLKFDQGVYEVLRDSETRKKICYDEQGIALAEFGIDEQSKWFKTLTTDGFDTCSSLFELRNLINHQFMQSSFKSKRFRSSFQNSNMLVVVTNA